MKFPALIKTLSGRERTIFVGAIGVFLIAAGILALLTFNAKTVAEPVRGGSYAEGMIGQPAYVNPLLLGDNDVDHDLVALLFSSVATLADKISPEDETGKLWTVVLKSDLKWSDGKPLTTADLSYTIRALQDVDLRSPFQSTWLGAVPEIVDDLTLRIRLRTPYVFFGDVLGRLIPAPKHIFGTIPLSNIRLSEYNLEPVGSGAYVFADIEKRKDGFIEKFIMEANPDFPGEGPFIEEFAVAFYENKLSAIDAFNSRRIGALGGLDGRDLDALKVGHKLFELTTNRSYAIFLNPELAPPLKDVAVREALQTALDIRELIDAALSGHGKEIYGPLTPSLYPEFRPASTTPPSLETAAKILDEAGWKLDDAGSRRKKIDKTEQVLQFDLTVPRAPFLVDAANYLAETWAKIGIKVNAAVLEPADVITNAIRGRNYAMLLFGQILGDDPDLYPFWHSSQRFYPGLNLALYRNATADGLLEDIRETADTEERKELLRKFGERIAKDSPAIFLFSPYYLYAAPEELGGVSEKALRVGADRFRNVAEWHLKTARTFK